MTVGELALLFNDGVPPGCHRPDGQICTSCGCGLETRRLLRRHRAAVGAALAEHADADTALVYPGTCMFEGTNLSEGRGTTRPFELIGAPYVDDRWADALRGRCDSGRGVPRGLLRADVLQVGGQDACGGVQLHVTDASQFDAVRTGDRDDRDREAALPGSTSPGGSDNWIDKLTGSTRFRTMVDAGASTDEVVAAWQRRARRLRRSSDEHRCCTARTGAA